MATTIVNNTPHKVAGIDVVLRRTVKGHLPTSYADLSNQAQVEFMAESVECKVRAGETGQADILTTIPPSMGKLSIPTFESNFIKVYYELICVIRVKRSVFSGGDTTYQSVIPLPIATHNIDNPMISGRTPRWTKTRLQPYFFEPAWVDPVGDLPGPSTSEPPSAVEPFISTVRTGVSPSASTSSLVTSPTTTTVTPSAMQEFLSGGSVELYRERTLKKSLTRSKSLKDIQSSRLNGGSWRTEREREQQQRDVGLSSQLNRSATDVSQPATSPNHGPVKRSPPLVPKNRSSNDDKRPSPTSTAAIIDSYVAYTPPPPSITPRSQRNPRESPLTAEQQVELARKASRRILPNQGSYTNEGILPPELANPETPPPPTPAPVPAPPVPTPAQSNSGSPTKPSSPTARLPPKRNASLSERSHLQHQNSIGSSNSTLQDTYLSEATGSRGRYNDQSNSPPTRQDRYDQQGSYTPLPVSPERVPYQHSLPAHQQPLGVVSTSTPLAGSLLERSPSRRDVPTTNGSLSNLSSTAGDFLPPPPFNKVIPSGNKDVPEPTGNGTTASSTSTHTYSTASSRIPPWERIEKVHHQNWFRPGPHQTGALTTFDAVGLPQATLQPVPIMKRSLPAPIEPIRSLEVEEQLR
ncbi:hypothetical protein BG003_009600 [Podila horticola]|nr:hypothetical protein BG003_009600 [Podila horticola]